MFLVFNKEKIYSYIIALTTVVILFGISIIYKDNENVVEVSTNIVNEIVTENNEASNKVKNNI